MKKIKAQPSLTSGTIMRLSFVVALIIIPIALFAQPTTIPTDVWDSDIPIDGGISALVVAGVGYGAKKLSEARKNKKAASDLQKEK